MAKLSKAVAVLMIGFLLFTQPACLTAALLDLGKPSGGPTEQPAGYTKAIRDGRFLALEYESTIDADGNTHESGGARTRIDLGEAQWAPLGAIPIDPYCTQQTWLRLLPNAPPQPPAPLILVRPSAHAQIAALHKQHATGFPPMTVQLQGLDAWILCGAGDAIGVTYVPPPPPPQSGERSTGAVVAIVILFPFALAVDITFGVVYAIVYVLGQMR
jgi:hypothetical protein